MNSTLGCIAIALLLVGCSGGSKTVQEMSSSGRLLDNQTLRVLEEEREFHLFLPDNPGAASIVLLLHGNGGSSDQLLGITDTKAPYKIWLDIARQDNLILIVPNGSLGANGKRGWNDCRSDAPTNPDSDDVRFLGDLIDVVRDRHGSIASSVFSVGTSNGGFMTMRLAEEAPESLDAIAIIAASKSANSKCVESRVPMPVLVMNGTDDPILPYDGGPIAGNRGEVYSTPETIVYWVNRNRTDLVPVESELPNLDANDGSTVRRYSYGNAAGNAVVEHYEVVNGGHTEPSLVERYGRLFSLLVGRQNGDIEMANEVWRFFQSVNLR